MAIQGSLEEAPLPDVLQLLSLGQKTGCLSLTEREMQGEICLDQGQVCHAAVFSRRDRLGDMLVRTGQITQQQLDDAIALERSEGRHVSQTLLASGQVERAELERFIRTQVEEAVYFMFTWRTGSFAFTRSNQPKRQEFLVAIDPQELLLEGARRVDEWSQIEKKIPSLDLVFRLDRSQLDGAPALTPEQQQILPLVDGTRDIHGIIELTGMAEFDVGKALYGLITAGIAKLVDRRATMRHLEYRELLAYVVREAEFAEPEQRRAAARHIADCATCTQRLKTIHVRRTGAVPSVGSATDSRTVEAGPDAAAPEGVAVSTTLALGATERRVSDRRGGDERREQDRRLGEDRRQARSLEWEQAGRDRRTGHDRRAEGRRISERRVAAAGGRESAAVVAARPLTLPQRSRSGERRVTGPRRIRPSGSSPGAPVQPKRNTGDGIRLRPDDDDAPTIPPAAGTAPTIARPAGARPPREEPSPKPSRSAAPVSQGSERAGDTTTEPTAEIPKRAASTPPRAAPEPVVVDAPTPRAKKSRRREPEVPELAPEVATKAEPPREQEDVKTEQKADGLAKSEEPVREAQPTAPGQTQSVEDARDASDEPEPDASQPPQPLPATVQPDPRPMPRRPPARSTDIEWLVSPDEANHLLRTSRVGLAAPTTETETPKPRPKADPAKAKAATPPKPDTETPKPRPEADPTKTKAATPPKPDTEAPKPRPEADPAKTKAATPLKPDKAAAAAPAKAKADPGVDRRAPRPRAHPGAPTAAAAAPVREIAPPRVPERTRPPERDVGSRQPSPAEGITVDGGHDSASDRPSRIRWLPLASAAVVLLGIGWAALPLLRIGGSTEPTPITQPVVRQDAALAPPMTAAAEETPLDAAPPPPATTAVEPPAQAPVQQPAQREAPPAPQTAPAVVAPPAPAPRVATISGVVRDGESGAALAGVQITIPGTAFATATDANGRYTFQDVPAGRITLAAAMDGRVPGNREVVLPAGETVQVDFGLALPAPAPAPEPPAATPAPSAPTRVTAREPDTELESGTWTLTDAATASARLRNRIATVPELWVESIAITETTSRPRARVALLTTAGERIVLTETRSGAPIVGGTPRVTALRIIPGTEAYPVTTGTASFGSLLVTAKATLDPDVLRALLTKLAEME